MLVELVAQPHCLYLFCTEAEATKYVYTKTLFSATQYTLYSCNCSNSLMNISVQYSCV